MSSAILNDVLSIRSPAGRASRNGFNAQLAPNFRGQARSAHIGLNSLPHYVSVKTRLQAKRPSFHNFSGTTFQKPREAPPQLAYALPSGKQTIVLLKAVLT